MKAELRYWRVKNMPCPVCESEKVTIVSEHPCSGDTVVAEVYCEDCDSGWPAARKQDGGSHSPTSAQSS